MMNDGKKQDEITAELGISRQTFWRDMQAIEARCTVQSVTDLQQFKHAQYQALLKIEDAVAKGVIEPEVANALTRVRDSVAKLLGLNAPSKSISVKADVDPQAMGMYRRFLHETRFVPPDAFEEIWTLCRRLSRPPTADIQMIGPPDDSPLWHDDEEENADVEGTTDQGQELEVGADSDRAGDLTADA